MGGPATTAIEDTTLVGSLCGATTAGLFRALRAALAAALPGPGGRPMRPGTRGDLLLLPLGLVCGSCCGWGWRWPGIVGVCRPGRMGIAREMAVLPGFTGWFTGWNVLMGALAMAMGCMGWAASCGLAWGCIWPGCCGARGDWLGAVGEENMTGWAALAS